MKIPRLLIPALLLLMLSSCGNEEKPKPRLPFRKPKDISEIIVPIDKGFNEYISGYTTGIISVNSAIEIRFTPAFAAKAKKETPAGLFTFEPAIRGKAEWTDNLTLTFRPAKILDAGTLYRGSLHLDKIADVQEKLKEFPLIIQTIKKDFIVTTGALECQAEGSRYALHGEITASDYIASAEVEGYLQARLGRKPLVIEWDHSDPLIHRFTITNIGRGESRGKVELEWNGNNAKVRQKGSATVNIPPKGEFSVIDIITDRGSDKKIDIVFSDPVDASTDPEGLIWFSPSREMTMSINSNIVTVIPATVAEGKAELNIESSLKSASGTPLSAPFKTSIDFSPAKPEISLIGNGVIIPSSQNLIFPFKAVNLKAVDLKIIRIYEENLPHFLQENDLNTGYSVKRFGRPLYTGRVDLINPSGNNAGGWNLYTIDLAEYIDIEPGILYRVELSFRPSYSLYPCPFTDEMKKYEEMLSETEEANKGYWDDPENYYSDSDDFIYYSFGFDWRDRDDPCKAAYFNPDRKVTRNILASNFGIIAKKGSDKSLTIFVNDILTALPLSEVAITVYDFQLQEIVKGNTGKNGSVKLSCEKTPFLITAQKDKDRNYLKVNEGASLSVSSFDVSGVKPEKGIKAFIYGERDAWRPGDSVFISAFIKDLNKTIPADHPVIFELVNPMGQVVDNQIQTPGGKNLLVFKSFTSPDAVTGDYKARLRLGGATFEKRVRIETIKPNRLRIDLNFPSSILGLTSVSDRGTLKVKWLNGAAAANLKSTVEYLLKPKKTEFEKYRQYNFDDPAASFYSETVKMFEGFLDGNGNSDVIFNPGAGIKAPGMLNAVFTVRAAETGGDESITQAVYPFAPYPAFAGIDLPGLRGKDRMLFTDRDNEVKIVTVDPMGNPVSLEAEITVYKISYRWWWESDQEDLASYISNDIYKPVITKTIRTSGGQGSFNFNIPRNEWGRYLIRVSLPSGHSTGKVVLVDWPWEYGMKGNAEGATLISVSTDKEKYVPGDEVRLSFPAPENSRIIITLENSTSVLDEIRAVATKGNSEVRFRVKPEMAPNVYAYVNVIQPHAQTMNDMPIRLYGIVPVIVEDPDTRLNPEISVPGEVRSGQNFEIRIRETRSKPMTYTIAVVDEGLLNLTGFRTPDPWNYFYAREALGIQTWDVYDQVLGAFGGTLQRIFAIGGDEALIDRSSYKTRRFVPVVRFIGPFTLGPGKNAVHHISLPQYTGSVRAMVIAGNEKAFGFAEKNVTVRDPLMILATAPRSVSPGEKVTLPVTVFIQKENIRNIDIFAESNDLVSFPEKVRSITVSGAGEKDEEFVFNVGEKTGMAKIRVRASGGGENAEYDINLSIRSPNPPETRSELRILRPGEIYESSFEPFGIPGSDEARIEASLLPSVNLEKNLSYLVNYPHGCTEQITSAAFPQLWIGDISAGQQGTEDVVSKNVREAIDKIASRQMNNGGIALWPGNYQPDNWVTSYAGHFMIEAERKGYRIPQDFKRKWQSYQRKTSQEWRYDPAFKESANDQAYRLLTLALAGNPERGPMNRLRESKEIPALSKWLLAAAFAVTGRPEAAGELLDMRNIDPGNEYSGYFYGSPVRDKSVILYTLSVMKKEEQALPLLKSICDELKGDGWYSTQSLSWALLSYMKFNEMFPGDIKGKASFSMTFNGTKSSGDVEPGKILLKELRVKTGKNTLSVENTSSSTIYLNLVRKGIPLVSDASEAEKGLSMKISYADSKLQPVDQKTLPQGTDFMMIAKVTNSSFSSVGNIALTQMVPSGWEIQNARLFEANYGIRESAYDYRDFRDDRVYTYFSLKAGETKTFVLVLNAAYKGEFLQPPVWCEAMYDGGLYARVPGTKVRVTEQ